MPLTSKELLEESRKRRTYRSFLEEPVDLEVIKDCILTAGTAPSGADKQPWHFCVVTDPETVSYTHLALHLRPVLPGGCF